MHFYHERAIANCDVFKMIGTESTNKLSKNEPQTPCLAIMPREAAAALCISERLLWDWTSKGIVPHIRLCKAIPQGRYRFMESLCSLLQYMGNAESDQTSQTLGVLANHPCCWLVYQPGDLYLIR